MRTRSLRFAVILSASASILWGQATPATPEAVPAAKGAAPAAPATPAAPGGATEPPKVTIQGTQPTGSGVSRNKDTLSVDFPDEDIRTILRNVADLFELNLVIPDTLQGKTSIKLRDVTWQQIFQVVLSPVGFTYVQDGNIIKVVSLQSLQQEPVTTDVFTLNYARATDIEKVVSSMVDTSKGGKLVVDSRTNSLIITERPSRLNKIRPIIKKLDKATDQVMIESKFVEVTSSDIKNIGINWSSLSGVQLGVGSMSQTWSRGRTQTGSSGFNNNNNSTNTSNNGTNSTSTNGTTGSLTTTNTGAVNTSTTQTNTGSQLIPTQTVDPITGVTTTTYAVQPIDSTGTQTTTSPATSQTNSTSGTNSSVTNTITNAVAAGTNNVANVLSSLTNTADTSRLATAVFSASDFNVILSALKTLSNTKIVSNPTIVTLNNTEAFINVGEEFPIPSYTYNQERGSFEVSGFTYKPIGIILRVTPQVNAQGFIKLTLNPEVSQQNGTTTFGGAGGAQIPIIATRTAQTQVSMEDGFTMAIGGLMRTQTTNGGTRVPLLGDIPLLGRLFRSDTKNQEVTNLIIFITAKTINAKGAPPEDVISPEQLRGLGMRRDELPGYREKKDPFLPAKSADTTAPANSNG